MWRLCFQCMGALNARLQRFKGFSRRSLICTRIHSLSTLLHAGARARNTLSFSLSSFHTLVPPSYLFLFRRVHGVFIYKKLHLCSRLGTLFTSHLDAGARAHKVVRGRRRRVLHLNFKYTARVCCCCRCPYCFLRVVFVRVQLLTSKARTRWREYIMIVLLSVLHTENYTIVVDFVYTDLLVRQRFTVRVVRLPPKQL